MESNTEREPGRREDAADPVRVTRRPYEKPVLVVYGAVHALTRTSTSGTGALDGGGSGFFENFYKT